MREIKFRVWDIKATCFRPINEDSDYLISPSDAGFILLDNGRSISSNNLVWQQYTGFQDKNGKEIYEGDILKLSDGDVSHHRIYWDKSGRWFDERLEDGDSQTAYDDFTFVTDCKVIGNIYENPELLGGSK